MPPKKPDPRTVYADIIDMPHHVSKTHPQMPLYKRAAQFAPFAALSGYEDMIQEDVRETEVSHKRELEEYELDLLNQKIQRIIALTEEGERPNVSITYFEADQRKNGGRYVTVKDAVKRVDEVHRVIELMTTEGPGRMNRMIKIEWISKISLCDSDPFSFLHG